MSARSCRSPNRPDRCVPASPRSAAPRPWRSALYFSVVAVLLILYALFMVRAFRIRGSEIERLGENTFRVRTLGYRDYIVFRASRDSRGYYRDLELLSSNESPLYASKAAIRAYLERLSGVPPEELAEIEGITGATVTVEAIQNALREIEGSPLSRFRKIGISALLWTAVLAIALTRMPSRAKRISLLSLAGACFVVVGVLRNEPVTIYSLLSWRSFYQLLPFLALASVLLYRNLYCRYICPFGFLQHLTGKIPMKRKLGIPAVISVGKYVLLGVAVASLFLGSQPYLEPYAYLFSRKPALWIYLFPAVILVLSIWIPHLWCRGFCPLGAALQIGRAVRQFGRWGTSPLLALRGTAGAANARGDKQTLWLPLLVFSLVLLSNVLLFLRR